MKILVTGGAGYIGSHTAVKLLEAGHELLIFDNFSNSRPEVLEALRTITGKDFDFVEGDLLNPADLERAFDKAGQVDAVIHFAALKAVAESVAMPLRYYENNISGTINLLKSMEAHNCKQIVFSSSATVYGTKNPVPCTEDMPTSAINPYGWTKVMMEQVLTDWAYAAGERKVVLLRYFNPVGAHESWLIGENPLGIPNNLMPIICRTAAGLLPQMTVCGDDYDTPDGSCIRDYIHVLDLADGHVKAIEHLAEQEGVAVYNLGTGNGISVLEMIETFKKVNDISVPYVIGERREGDLAVSYADASKAERKLGWKATHNIADMCRDSWNFYKTHKD